MHLILTGATGLVGSAVLSYMTSLGPDKIDKISIISRKPVPEAAKHPHINVIIHKDFTNYADILDQLQGASGCVWALGTAKSSVSNEEYEKITVELPVAAAKAFSTLSDPFKFVYVSGEGATETPSFYSPAFAPIKARAESYLLSLMPEFPSLSPYSVRPGFVDVFQQPDVAKQVAGRKTTFVKKLIPVLGPVWRTLYPSGTSPTPAVGMVLTELAMGDGGALEGEGITGKGRTVSNVALRILAGLDTGRVEREGSHEEL